MFYKSEKGLTDDSLKQALEESLMGKNPHKVLILPPDYTRMYSGAGKITAQNCKWNLPQWIYPFAPPFPTSMPG